MCRRRAGGVGRSRTRDFALRALVAPPTSRRPSSLRGPTDFPGPVHAGPRIEAPRPARPSRRGRPALPRGFDMARADDSRRMMDLARRARHVGRRSRKRVPRRGRQSRGGSLARRRQDDAERRVRRGVQHAGCVKPRHEETASALERERHRQLLLTDLVALPETLARAARRRLRWAGRDRAVRRCAPSTRLRGRRRSSQRRRGALPARR